MYKKLSVKDRMDYMSMYKKAYPNSSYRDMVESYNDLDKYPDGGSTGPHRTYNINDIPTKQLPPSSETVQTQYQKPENPYLKGNLLDYRNNINAEEKAKRDYAESIRLAQEQILKDKTKKFINSPEGKKYLEEGVNNSINNPVFKAVTYATPIGTVVGGIEGIANLAPDLYNNNYKKAIIDAASMIPLVGKGIPNLYKYNPWAFKPNPEAYYRMIGKEGYADALESGVIRPPQYHYITPQGMPKVGEQNVELINGQLKQRLNFPQYEEAYYNAQFPLDKRWYPQNKVSINPKTGKRRLTGYEGPYMVEVTGNPHLFENAENVAAYTGPNASQTVTYSKEFIPTNTPGVKFYKEDWLRGYKPVEVTEQSAPVRTVQDWLDNNAKFINLEKASSKPKSKMYKASEIVEDPNFNIKKIYRGDKEVPKVIRVQGNSGEWTINRSSDGSYYFNAGMSSPFESGKAMSKINELLPPKPVILEPNSLSLDSYKNVLKLGKKPHWKMEFENYIPLNHSAIHDKTLINKFGLKLEGTHVPFNSLEDANVALKEVNAMLKKQGIKYEADIFGNGNGWYGIKIPNFKLTRDYKQGGVIKDDRGQWAHPGEIKAFNLVPPAIGTSLYLKSQQNNKE